MTNTTHAPHRRCADCIDAENRVVSVPAEAGARPVAYYNDNWTLTPHAYAEAMKRDPVSFADLKPAYAAPAPALPAKAATEEMGRLIDKCAADWHDWQEEDDRGNHEAWTASRNEAIEHFRRHAAPASAASAPLPVDPKAAQPIERTVEPCYSLNEEDYVYQELAEVLDALEDRGALVEGAVFYEGDSIHPRPSEFFDLHTMLESLSESAYDRCGEWAEDFPDVEDTALKQLETLVSNWLDAHIGVTFWEVTNSRKVTVTAEMIAAHRADAATAPQAAQAGGEA